MTTWLRPLSKFSLGRWVAGWLAAVGVLGFCVPVRAQAHRHFELTLAGLRPGVSRLSGALRRFGPRWSHPSGDEHDIYQWYDARRRLAISVEVSREGIVRYVTVWRHRLALASTVLPPGSARTGLGLRLGQSPARARALYGPPFFSGPSVLDRRQVLYVSFKFSWAGADKPQVLECSFNAAHRLIKMTLSADYY